MNADQLFETEEELQPEPPDAPPAEVVTETLAEIGRVATTPQGISTILPQDFPLRTLLAFLPDVRLKRDLQALAAEALAVNVQAEGGLARADELKGRIGDKVREICALFDGTDLNPGPTKLAFTLHSRLTGLRKDFTQDGVDAEKKVGERMLAENKRLDDIAAQEQREAQARADRAAKVEADRAAKEAAEAGAPKAVVTELKRQAQTATAPPVPAAAPPPLSRNAAQEFWRTRLTGCALAEPQVEDLSDLPAADQETARKFFRAVADGKIPLAAAGIKWGYLNKRAAAEKSAMALPCIEAYDQGTMRRKGGRR